ncbi:MAG TPA: bifunctional 4-hydroxy-2-oxoglutarate aldolase/2-dehydro-3-deoxy-phosphogluconate aldolase [Azospirillaceae bacterium]|nr:bifunctional 4-hydroxy-2-oxoglutarate aldolase/2-dehydro-3-deoxy-phosphogluconate aldolase [Azospirillaceae bacterium]
MTSFVDILRACPVIPVLVIDREEDAVPLAEALRDGGLTTLEVTLRTPAALGAIRRMKSVAGVRVGAGTVLSADDVKRAADAGSDFLVTPGTSPRLVQPLLDSGLPAMPGVATPSEAAARLEEGFPVLKLFPAEQCGGVETLKAWGGPLFNALFCPTGGIGRDKVADYLALKNVVAVGGSWIAPTASVRAGDWSAITENARVGAGFGARKTA